MLKWILFQPTQNISNQEKIWTQEEDEGKDRNYMKVVSEKVTLARRKIRR